MAKVAPTNIDHFYVKLAPSGFSGIDIGNIPGSQIISHEVNITYASWTMVRTCFIAKANYGKLILYPLGDDWDGVTWVDVDDVSIMEYQADESGKLPCSKCELANDSSSLQIGETKENKLKVISYPNPAKENVNFELQLRTAGTVSIVLYNIQGQAIKTIAANESLDAGVSTIVLATDDIAAGTYYCRVQFNEEVYTEKVVIIR